MSALLVVIAMMVVILGAGSVYGAAKESYEYKKLLEQTLQQYFSSDWRSADNVCMRILWDKEDITRQALIDALERLIREGKIECRVPENFSGRLGECRIAQSST